MADSTITRMTAKQAIELGKLVASLKNPGRVTVSSHRTYSAPEFITVEISTTTEAGFARPEHVYLIDAGGGQHKLPTRDDVADS